jgi:ribosomal protein S18 acetylase RimI-like enzyme
MIVRMQQCHIERVVEVHLESFPGFFLTFLGRRFLQLLYSSIVSVRQSVNFVYLDQDILVGFVVGVANPSRFYSKLIRERLFAFAWAAIAATLRRPSIIGRLFRALLYPSKSPGGDSNATLLSIAIKPFCQGRGIGKALIDAFLAEMKKRGVSVVNLTTDRDDNAAANEFYHKLGFRIARVLETPEHRFMNEYEWSMENDLQSCRAGLTARDITASN